ncbi:MAG: ABC transporter ATP-binding protein [Peptostreptococcaceae bacterium]|nr:ABC transporter ATP-binding protein [Peptostreptococcaceae bacterium]
MLEVKNLSVSFRMYDRKLDQIIKKAVHDISMDVQAGEIHAVVGSSGSGKSLLAHAVMDILPDNAIMGGEIYFEKERITTQNIKKLRGKAITLIPQSISYLDPLMKTNRQIFGKVVDAEKQRSLFESFNLKVSDGNKFPFQLSGGMARRALIMTSVVTDSKLVVADEPTPGLNPQLATEILSVFRTMADEGRGILLITHDVDLVCEVADRISIFYGGTILETLSVKDFLAGNADHPYTKALWNALPQNNFEAIDMMELARICKEQGYPLPDHDNIFE